MTELIRPFNHLLALRKFKAGPFLRPFRFMSLFQKGFFRPEEAAPFGDVDVLLTVSIDKTDPQQIIARVRLSSGLVLVELADGSIQQATQSLLDRLDSR